MTTIGRSRFEIEHLGRSAGLDFGLTR